MKVSDDVTLLWSDDNRGNIRRIPIGNEPNRSGGSGMYYHFDYVGDPRNYKWINTIQLQKTWEQMTLAYDRGIENIWIANVGDLKALVSRNLYESPNVPANRLVGTSYSPLYGLGLGQGELPDGRQHQGMAH